MNKISFIFIFAVVCLVITAGVMMIYQKNKTQDLDIVGVKDPVDMIPPFIPSESLSFNNENLIDSTVYDQASNTCTAIRNNMKITVYPCGQQDIDGSKIEQQVNFTWLGGTAKNLGWYFVYNGDLQAERIEEFKDVQVQRSEKKIVSQLAQISVDNIESIEDLGVPDRRCTDGGSIGNADNEHMYSVTRVYLNGSRYTEVYCAAEVLDLDAATVQFDVQRNELTSVIETVTERRFVNQEEQIEKVKGLIGDEYSYYNVKTHLFQPQETLQTKWIYTPNSLSQKEGKWHVIGYDADIGVLQSLITNSYIYMDPWWDNSWTYRRIFNVTENLGVGHTVEPVLLIVNTTGLIADGKMQADCDDIRVTNSTDVEVAGYNITYCNSAATRVYFPYSQVANRNETFYLYYGNGAATAGTAYYANYSKVIFNSTQIELTANNDAFWYPAPSGAGWTVQANEMFTGAGASPITYANASFITGFWKLQGRSLGHGAQITGTNISSNGAINERSVQTIGAGAVNWNSSYLFFQRESINFTLSGIPAGTSFTYWSTNPGAYGPSTYLAPLLVLITSPVGAEEAGAGPPLNISAVYYSNNDNKLIYYKFNQGSGTTVINQLGSPNGTYDTAPQWEQSSWPGYQNASRHPSTLLLNTTFLGNASVHSNFTLEFRLNASDVTADAIVTWGNTTSNGFGLAYDGTGAGTFSWIIGPICNQTNGVGAGTVIGQKVYIVITRNDTTWKLYQDGVMVHNRSCPLVTFSDYNLTFGDDPTNYFTSAYSGQVDQFILWDRPLNITEILFLNSSTDDGSLNVVTLVSPTNNSLITSNPVTFNISMTPAYTFNNTNVTINVWYSNGTLFNTTTKPLTSNVFNSTLFSIDNFISGTYFWGAYACFNNLASKTCVNPSSNLTFSVLVLSSSTIYNASTYETASENFFANVTIDPSKFLTSANLIYKGSPYSATVAQVVSNNYTLSRSIDIPLGAGSNSFFWNLLFNDSTYQNTSAGGQTIAPINLSICTGAPFGTVYINFTFKNETTNQERVPGTITSTWSYFMGSGTVNKTYSFSNSTENQEYTFCYAPQNRSIRATPAITYANSYSASRSYSPGTLSLSNSSTNQVLYLLPNNAGATIIFQVRTTGGSAISGAFINVSRSGFGTIGTATTDDAGLASFFLNTEIAYTITTSADGFATSIQTITPITSPYTITLGGSSGSSNSSVFDFSQGVVYRIGPTTNPLSNNTNYTFTFEISSNYWGLASYGFNITTLNGTRLGTVSGSTSTGSLISTSVNTGNNSYIKMNYFWYVGGNLTAGSNTWVVVDGSDTDTSILNLITDLRRYINSTSDGDGLFGLSINTSNGNFSLAIIVFIILFSFAGIMSYRYGLTSEAAIALILSTGIVFFDVALGFMPAILGIDHFLSMFSIIIVVALFAKEIVT